MASIQPLTFSQVLRGFRRAAGLTQEELAERSSLSTEGISSLERGVNRSPRRDTVELLAQALQLSPDDRTLLEASARRQRIPTSTASATPAAGMPTVLLPGALGAQAARRASNLPAPLTPIIGREHEEAAAVHPLRQGDVRLLTLVGAPGIGKTRLALQVATDLRDDASDGAFPDGVFLVELAPIADPTLVPSTILRTLEVRESGGTRAPPLATLTAHLRTRRLLLLLDNFEQVVVAAPQVAELLQACPGLSVLATSRVPLHVRGEHRLAIPPLAFPDLATLPPTQDLARYPAIALFIQRAREVSPAFALTPAQAPAVAAICHRLDGLPLAIELAAVWTRLLSPSALLARLAQRLPLLSAGARDLPERQQTLRGAIEWSHDLLTPAEQALLRRLGVFLGGWTVDAAEAVCGEAAAEAGDTGNIEAVLHALAMLVDTSLVDRQEEAGSGEIRFRLLELVREYALERLETSGEAEVIRERHARYYMGLARRAGIGLAGPEMEVWIAHLARENDNLRAALGWAKQHDIASGLRVAVEIMDFWMYGQVNVGRAWLEELLDLDARGGMGAPPTLRAFALNAAGILAHRQDDYTHAMARHVEALALARRIGQRRVIANALNMLGNNARIQGDQERARMHYEDALAHYQEIERRLDAAAVDRKAGSLADAELEVVWRELGLVAAIDELGGAEFALADLVSRSKRGTVALLGNLARLALDAGDFQRAGELFEYVRAVFADLGRSVNEAQACSDLGQVALLQGNFERARVLLESALPIVRQAGVEESVAAILSLLGRVAHGQGNPTRAVALHQESLALRQAMGDREGMAMDLEGLGIAMSAAGQVEPAVRILGKAAALRDQITVPLSATERETVDRVIADLRRALGEERFAAAWAVARIMPLEQLLADG